MCSYIEKPYTQADNAHKKSAADTNALSLDYVAKNF